jgi:hypothetical protein
MIDVLIHQATRTEPSDDELRTQSLTRLGKTYGIARSPLYSRKQRLINPRQHHRSARCTAPTGTPISTTRTRYQIPWRSMAARISMPAGVRKAA